MGNQDKLGSQSFVEPDEEPYHCVPTYQPSDIICPGSDTEETPEETKAKRQRYEDAAQRYIAGEKPRIISATLRGPLDAKSGWVNPWRYRPPKARNEDWWQPGSDSMLFTRENVMRRAVSYGLGYMAPKEALAWCKASARVEVDMQLGTQFQHKPMKSIEQDYTAQRESTDQEIRWQLANDVFGAEDGNHAGDQPLTTTTYRASPSKIETGGGSKRRNKRPVDTQWLRGSHVSKRARWDGPALPSPTPANLNVLRGQRRHQIPPTRAAPSNTLPKIAPAPDFESIQRLRPLPMAQNDTPGSVLSHFDPREPSQRGESVKSQQYQSPKSPYRQIDVEEYWDESTDANSSFSPPPPRPKSRSSTADSQDHSFSDFESDDPTTTPAGSQNTNNMVLSGLSSASTSTSNSNKLPPLPPAESSQQSGAGSIEEDSFITAVVPSSRDLEKFMFRKKRKAFERSRAEASPRLLDWNEGEATSVHKPRNTPGHGKKEVNSPLPMPTSSGMETIFSEPIVEQRPQPIIDNVPTASGGLSSDISSINSSNNSADRRHLVQSHFKEPLHVENTEAMSGTFQQRSSFLQHFSQITQPNDQPSFQKLPINATPALESGRNEIKFHSQKLSKNAVSPVGNPVDAVVSQASNDVSTQSYNTTPACSRGTPLKSLNSSRKSPNVGRLQRFSFENGPGNLLFSLGSSSTPDEQVMQVDVASKVAESFKKENHKQTPLQTELGDYRAYIGGNVLGEAEQGYDDILQDESNSQVELDGVVADGLGASEDDADQIQQAISPNCMTTTPGANKKSPRDDRQSEVHSRENTPQLSKPIVAEGSYVEKEKTPLVQHRHRSTSPKSVKNELLYEAREQVLSDHTESIDEAETEASIPEVDRYSDIDTIHPTMTSHIPSDFGGHAKATPRQVMQTIQSPFAQEQFIIEKPILAAGSCADLAAVSDAESETSWEGCGPQSPWALESSDNFITYKTTNQARHALSKDPSEERDLEFSDAPEDIALGHQSGQANDDGIFVRSPQTPDADYSGITPFGNLISPSPPLVLQPTNLGEVHTNTQQLVDAALQNPWASSVDKKAPGKVQKHVSFDHASIEDNEGSDDFEIFKEAPGSPPPDEDVFNEVVFGAGFTQATPFSNHFKVARKFSRILPDAARSPSRSSPPLSGQAEAFIAADLEGPADRQRRPKIMESPTRYLKPRSDTDENSHWRDWEGAGTELDGISPRNSKHKQNFTTSMPNFDMDEALNQMGDFLEDWSVETELKKAKELNTRREREDSGRRRRKLFGLI